MARYDGQERHDRHDHRRGGNVNPYFRDIFVFVFAFELVFDYFEYGINYLSQRNLGSRLFHYFLYSIQVRGIRNLEIGILTFVLYCFINKESGIWNMEHML